MLTLHPFHGRLDPKQDMDDWGFQGPLIQNVLWMHTTYLNRMRVGFATEAAADEAQALTGWEKFDTTELWPETHEDMLVTTDPDGTKKYYGDWSLGLDITGDLA